MVLVYDILFLRLNHSTEELNRKPARHCQCKRQSTTGFPGMFGLWSKAVRQKSRGIASFAFGPSKAYTENPHIRQAI